MSLEFIIQKKLLTFYELNEMEYKGDKVWRSLKQREYTF